MKKLLLLVFTLSFFGSCEEKISSKDKLIGTWDIYEGGQEFVGSTTFYGDFTVRIDRGREINGDWRVTPNYTYKGQSSDGLCLSGDKRSNECFAITWINDNKCILWEENEEDYVTLKRK